MGEMVERRPEIHLHVCCTVECEMFICYCKGSNLFNVAINCVMSIMAPSVVHSLKQVAVFTYNFILVTKCNIYSNPHILSLVWICMIDLLRDRIIGSHITLIYFLILIIINYYDDCIK